jgi:hypothetical protein
VIEVVGSGAAAGDNLGAPAGLGERVTHPAQTSDRDM